jgi:acyl transferase domain-containing protein
MARYLEEKRDALSEDLDRLAFTLASKRTTFPWRNFVLAGDLGQLQDKLAGNLQGGRRSTQKANIAFLFSGQGAQWNQMGKELLDVYPIFRTSLVAATDYLQRKTGCKLSLIGKCSLDTNTGTMIFIANTVTPRADELLASNDSTSIHDPRVAQPLCTALQVALVQLLHAWGVRPARVVGHSSGEIAAAYCCDAITQEEAWLLAYYRGVASSSASGKEEDQAMAAVGMAEKDLLPHIGAVASRLGRDALDVACLNSPTSSTVSGSAEAVDMLCAAMEEAQIPTSRLLVRNAYHSRYMEKLAAEYQGHIAPLLRGTDNVVSEEKSNQRAVLMFSSVTGEAVSKAVLRTPEYWAENMRSKVRFSQALEAAATQDAVAKTRSIKYKTDKSPVDLVVEIGPHSVLRSAVRQTLRQDQLTGTIEYFPSIVRNVPALESMLTLAGNLFCRGVTLDFAQVNQQREGVAAPKMLVDLPPYPWNHEATFWQESRFSKFYRFREHSRHDLLGKRVQDWNPMEPRWRHWLRIDEMPWLQDHRVRVSSSRRSRESADG